MLTNAMVDSLRKSSNFAAHFAKKVVIVNGTSRILELFDSVLDEGRYDVVFVESNQHAYSQIKRVLPDLVILCISMDEVESLQVLSMLKLDAQTRDIPTLTFAAEGGREQSDQDVAEPSGGELFAPKPAVWMN